MSFTNYLEAMFFCAILIAIYSMYRYAQEIDENDKPIKKVKPKKIKMIANNLRIIKKFAWFPIQINRYQISFWAYYRCQQKLVFHKFWGWRWKSCDKWM